MAFQTFIAEIMIFAGNFAPKGYAFCDGQSMSISQNTALFSLLGTTYGGDGRTTFNLPDLRGRVPIDAGQGPGLSNYLLGDNGGVTAVALDQSTTPVHTHQAQAFHGPTSGTSASPAAQQWAYSAQDAYGPAGNAAMAVDALNAAGANQPHDNMSPYQSLNFCIALVGVFPARS
jgi:microcystin-dependent protein